MHGHSVEGLATISGSGLNSMRYGGRRENRACEDSKRGWCSSKIKTEQVTGSDVGGETLSDPE